MSYYEDEEERRASAYFLGLVLKIGFNIAIIIILFRFLYFPNYPEELRNPPILYLMPIVGLIGTYLYASFWFGWKNSLYMVGLAGFSFGIVFLTSFDTLITIYGIGFLLGLAYAGYLLIKLLIQTIKKR